MDQINIYALIYPSEEGDYLCATSYDILGQGRSFNDAKLSAISVVVNYIDAYVSQKLPIPNSKVCKNLEEITTYFSEYNPKNLEIIKEETVVEQLEDFPKLIFEFYRLKN